MGRDLERLQGLGLQRLVQPRGKLRPDAGNGPEQPLGVERPAQPLELRPAAGQQHLGERRRDRWSDRRKRVEARTPLRREYLGRRLIEGVERVGRAAIGHDAEAIGVLLFQEVGVFAQPCCKGSVCLGRPPCRVRFSGFRPRDRSVLKQGRRRRLALVPCVPASRGRTDRHRFSPIHP
jgi:hypothetical protein